MEQNTVCISLEEYNHLKKFKETMEEYGVCLATYKASRHDDTVSYKFMSQAEAFKINTDEYDKLKLILEGRDRYVIELKSEIRDLTTSLNYVKHLSVSEFRKYKKRM